MVGGFRVGARGSEETLQHSTQQALELLSRIWEMHDVATFQHA